MSKKEIIVIVAAVIIIVIGVGIYYWSRSRSGENSATGTSESASSTANNGMPPMPSSTTAQQLPSGSVTVPGQNASSVPAGVAAPTVVASGSPSGVTSYRSFDIKISGNAFSPNTVIVNEGDTVHINLTAADAAYDFTQPDYGVNLQLAKGQTKFLQFDADMTGKFTFYCKSCGGPSKGPTGYIEVVAK